MREDYNPSTSPSAGAGIKATAESDVPELPTIIEMLRNSVSTYESIVVETGAKLQFIKKYQTPSNIEEQLKSGPPESAAEDLRCLIRRLEGLNELAYANLNHLKRIV